MTEFRECMVGTGWRRGRSACRRERKPAADSRKDAGLMKLNRRHCTALCLMEASQSGDWAEAQGQLSSVTVRSVSRYQQSAFPTAGAGAGSSGSGRATGRCCCRPPVRVAGRELGRKICGAAGLNSVLFSEDADRVVQTRARSWWSTAACQKTGVRVPDDPKFVRAVRRAIFLEKRRKRSGKRRSTRGRRSRASRSFPWAIMWCMKIMGWESTGASRRWRWIMWSRIISRLSMQTEATCTFWPPSWKRIAEICGRRGQEAQAEQAGRPGVE